MWSPALFVATLSASVSVSAAADAPRVNGWYPCAFSTETNEAEYGSSFDDMTVFECAEIELPLCYEGVCKSDRKIDVFVKRLLAENSDGGARKALVLVEGGPGFAATGMEDKMVSLVQKMIGAVDFYTFDHRGTGRSEFLECDAAQALTKGSPDGKQLSMEELQACLQDLNFKYDDQAAAFSTTSAAMDVRAMIETFMADQEVYVAGYSYGTYLTQRLMQLQPPQVVGYIFDGVDVLSGKNDTLQSANSHWNEAIIVPGQRVLEHCYDDDKCGIKFKSRETVLEDTIAFFDELDANTTNPCAKVLVETGDYEQPSVNLRNMLGQMVTDYDTRAIALKVIAKVQRCSVSDVSWLSTFFGGDSGDDEEDTDEVAIVDSLNDVSSLLYNVIVFSERWSQPGPTQEERDANFMGGVFSTDDSETALQYCVYTGADDKACQELKDKIPSKINQTFFYPHDKYVDGILALPDHASALIINGGLDLQTPQEFGELLYEKISGTGKGAVMVNFEYGIHCAGEAVAGSDGSPCRDSITASFIENSGDLESINTNCMSSLPRATFGWDDSEKKKMKLHKKKKH